MLNDSSDDRHVGHLCQEETTWISSLDEFYQPNRSRHSYTNLLSPSLGYWQCSAPMPTRHASPRTIQSISESRSLRKRFQCGELVAVLRLSWTIYSHSAASGGFINATVHLCLAARCTLRLSKRSCASFCFDFPPGIRLQSGLESSRKGCLGRRG